MTRIAVENEQQCSISLSEFRLNKLQLNETPCKLRYRNPLKLWIKGSVDIGEDIGETFWRLFVGYETAEKILGTIKLMICKPIEHYMHQSTCHDSKTGDSLYKTNQ